MIPGRDVTARLEDIHRTMQEVKDLLAELVDIHRATTGVPDRIGFASLETTDTTPQTTITAGGHPTPIHLGRRP